MVTGSVAATNLMGGKVTSLTSYIDSMTRTGVTLASGSGAGASSGIITS